ncbi:BON domain-containing protein [Pseudolysinimonas sp.]|uniref:BON domain-containing protein n=1 Tax=Pseudolysinimonas sp. TaxID=2680009 RepID=UPI003F81524D
MNATEGRTDEQIQEDVLAELRWTPDVDAAGIGVAVEDGTVTLTGQVDSYIERVAAAQAALRVRGVTALADELRVRPVTGEGLSDSAIAHAIEHGLAWATDVPDGVQVVVRDGVATLHGEVMWQHQRQAAEHLAARTRGVRAVKNRIVLSLRASAAETEEVIRHALRRHAHVDEPSVHVAAVGTRVTLTGTVRTPAESRHAEHAAWGSPNVTAVENRLTVTGEQ